MRVDTGGKWSDLYVTKHGWERLRQRIGIESRATGIAWVKAKLEAAERTENEGHQTKYFCGAHVLIMDGTRLVTVHANKEGEEGYASLLRGRISKEATKFIAKKKAELRKLEITLLETQMNLLKAKNPKIKRIITEKLTGITDEKARIEDSILGMRIAAQDLGAEGFEVLSEEW